MAVDYKRITDLTKIKIIYYFKKNHKVIKVDKSYWEFLKIIGFYNMEDNKGNNYNYGYSYQLLYFQNLLLNNEDLKVFKCNFYLNDEIIPL
tara:strand:+ start:907 stop:1179 length:273 start_codon:yes stop_codon:yes gene_type:complete